MTRTVCNASLTQWCVHLFRLPLACHCCSGWSGRYSSLEIHINLQQQLVAAQQHVAAAEQRIVDEQDLTIAAQEKRIQQLRYQIESWERGDQLNTVASSICFVSQ